MANQVKLPFFEDTGRVFNALTIQQITAYGWHMNVYGIPDLHQLTRGNEDTIVAVLDTGVDVNHPDLANKVVMRYDATGEGFGVLHPHGTHVAGIIAANGRIVGVAPNVKLYDVKVLDSQGGGTSDMVVKGINWAVKEGAHIINMSLGMSSSNDPVSKAIEKARAAGVIVVCAAGNSGDSGVNWPGADPQTLAVAAAHSEGVQGWKIANFSSKGGATDIAAPGVDILSTVLQGGYAAYNGTSMATPFVVGVICLILDRNTLLKHDSLVNLIKMTAIDIGLPGEDDASGAGIIDVNKLVKDSKKFKEVAPVDAAIESGFRTKILFGVVVGIILVIILQIVFS